MTSALVVNSQRSMTQRRRGKFVMMDMKAVREKYGAALARQMHAEKKELEEKKSADDPVTYFMKNPDVDHEVEVTFKTLLCLARTLT